MVFIPDPDTDPTTPADAVRVPEFYPRTDDRAPFNHRDNVRIRTDESFEKYYEIYGEPLGEGKFGKVYECRERASGLVLAAKFIKIRKDPDRKTVEREVSIMTQMRHPRIAQIYDAFWQGKNDVILVMEIVRGGELFNRVAEETYVLTEKAVTAVICQLCEVIDYMHSQNIIHLDIKPENIMCVSETGNSIKLIDFGLAQLFDPSKDLYLMAGTPEFAAPEVIKYEPLEYRTDMWSVGVITYILLSGYSPFLGDTTPETYVNVERGEWAFTEEFDFVSEPAKDFITRLLSYNKSERMLPSECLKHEWLAGVRSLVADEETLSSPAALAGPALAAAQLRRYVIRRRFRKIGLVVRTCVQLRLRMEASRSRSITPRVEASSSSSTPPEVKDEFVVAPVEAASTTNVSMADEISEALPTPAIKTTSPDEISSVGESGKLKKKKKPKTTISSETERPSEKKLKRAEASESSKENAAALAALPSASEAAAPSTTEAAADQKTKKRLKKEVSAAAATTASSTEMPAKMSKKAKSPSPTTNSESLRSPVPVIYEEGIKIDEPEKKKETTTVKKKKTKPAGSDSAVTLSEEVDKNRQPAKKEKPEEKLPPANNKIAAAPSGSLLTTPEAATPAAAKKSLSASAAPVEETRKTAAAEKASGSSSNLAVPSGSAGKIRAKSSSGSLIGARIQQLAVASEKPPSIVVQPPTPAGSAAGRRPLNGGGRIEAVKKRLWKQENVKEGKAEEVVVLPKGEQLTPLILPVFDASESLRKKNSAEKSATEKKSEVEPKSAAASTASRAPSSAKVIPVTEEKSSTTTTVTTTKVRRKKKEEDSGVVVESDSKHIEEAANKVIETAKISVSKVELKEETMDEKAKKTTVKKSVLNKTTTSTATQKQRTEGVDKADPNATVTSSLAQSQKSELSLSTKTKVDSVVEKDVSIKLAKEIKKKLTVKSEPEPRSEEEKPRKTTSAVLAGKETVTVSKSDGKTTETLKKTTSLRTRMPSPSAEKSEREDSSPPNEDKLKKKKTVLKKMKSMPTEEKPFIEYPASLAEDIQKFKACRSKAKAREEEIQRHVRFALEEDMSKSAYVETASMRSARLERTISDGASSTSSSSDHTGGSLTPTKTRRRTSYFEITEDEQETLAAGREDFSFSTLRERLERQLTKRGGSPSDDEEAAAAPRPKELIRCPSTNSLLKKWRTFEQAHA